jgi:hypothetical protein
MQKKMQRKRKMELVEKNPKKLSISEKSADTDEEIDAEKGSVFEENEEARRRSNEEGSRGRTIPKED